MFYRINWHAATHRMLLESGANSPPTAIGGTGMTDLGSFEYDNETEESTGLNGMQGLADNHVVFHHIQDALYKVGVMDVQSVKILIDSPHSISIDTESITVAVGADSAPLNVTVSPTTANHKEVIYTSSDKTKATVNEEGVVHGIAAGNVIITAKLKIDETVTATCNVEVPAEEVATLTPTQITNLKVYQRTTTTGGANGLGLSLIHI